MMAFLRLPPTSVLPSNPQSLSPILPRLRRRLSSPAASGSERGLLFDTGTSFFRHESFTARDLAALSAALLRRALEPLPIRVLDAMCGCGVRSLRYLAHSGVDFVWANDANDEYRGVITSNLSCVGRGDGSSPGGRRWVVTHMDVRKVLAESFLGRDYFDLIDVDSFGGDSSFLRASFEAIRFGGHLYLTSTDGFSSGGHRPQHSLASYGAYVRPMPFANEVGLRMLIGGALREAAALGLNITPLFSYYSYHGPVFRVMLRVDRGKFQERSYGFVSYCNKCGNSQVFSWKELGHISCQCRGGQVSSSVVVSGPLWIGPLHDTDYVTDMFNLAKEWGWLQSSKEGLRLEKLLKRMIDESDPKLPPGYTKLDEIASRGKINAPPLSTLIDFLRKEGYAASRSHVAPSAIKTNCPFAVCIEIAKELCNTTVV